MSGANAAACLSKQYRFHGHIVDPNLSANGQYL
jgi:hypothetical protein